MIRHISHERLDFNEDETKSDNKKVNFYQLVKEIESKEVFSLDELTTKCAENNLLKMSDIKSFYSSNNDITNEQVLDEINANKSHYQLIANEIGNNGKRYKTLNGDYFITHIQDIIDQVQEKDPYLSLLAWKIYQSELQRVKAEFFNYIIL